MRVFYRLLINSLVSGFNATFLWWALTFWMYLETGSVVKLALIGASFYIAVALLGMVFGTYVDQHRKHQVLVRSSVASIACYGLAGAMFLAFDTEDLVDLKHPMFYVFLALVLLGSVIAELRSIAVSTCVSLLVPEGERERANGMIGTVSGVSFAMTSMFSGYVVGRAGMGWALILALVAGVFVLGHITTITIDEPDAAHLSDGTEPGSRVDFKGALAAIRRQPGLLGLIFFSAFNNLLAGVFLALLDAYGLALVSVETWGLLAGLASFGFIIGGLFVARRGLGGRPLRVLLLANAAAWVVCSLFVIRSSPLTLFFGLFLWMLLMPIMEAAEQTLLQRAVPFESQGRVFGFAKTVEQGAAPIVALIMGPLAETVFIPFMTDGKGVDWIGGWFGTGPERGIALVFCLAGIVGLLASVVLPTTRSYQRLRELESAPRPLCSTY